MKLKSGNIKNINKKLIAGALVFTLVSVPFAGCDSVSIDSINYVTTEQGNSFTVNRETINYCSFYRVYNNKVDKEYYTIAFKDEFNGSYFVKYYDIFTKEEIKYSENSFKSIMPVNDYLEENDMVKEVYTSAELEEILNIFVEKQEKNKQLVKE